MSDNLPHSADVASRSIKIHVDDCRGLTSGFVVELIIWQFINRRCEEATYYTAPRKIGIIFHFFTGTSILQWAGLYYKLWRRVNLPMIKELLTILWCETIAAPTIGSHDNLICTVIAKVAWLLAEIGPGRLEDSLSSTVVQVITFLTIDYIIVILGKPYHILTIQIENY